MIQALLLPGNGSDVLLGGEELISQWRENPQAILWVDINAVSQIEQQRLFALFDIDPLAVQDVQRVRHPPKIEDFGDYIFFLLRGLDAHTKSLEFKTIQISLFVGKRFLLSCHDEESLSLQHHWTAATTDHEWLANGTAWLATRIAVRIARRFVPILLDLEPRLAELEDELIINPNDRIMAELISYKTRLRRLKRTFSYHERMFRHLQELDSPLLGDDLIHELNNVYEQYERLSSLSTMYYEMAGDLIDGYISTVSHRLNNTMRVLTVITAIFVPLSFLAGVYGMNFEHMPELHTRNGYFILLGLMGTIALALLYLFRRMRWL